MKEMPWKTIITIAIVITLILGGLGLVASASYGKLLLTLVSWVVGVGCGWYAKLIYDKYFKKPDESSVSK